MTTHHKEDCWSYWNCPPQIRDNCEVFKSDMGKECWYIMHLKKGCPASEKYGSCFNCPWYKNKNGDSPCESNDDCLS